MTGDAGEASGPRSLARGRALRTFPIGIAAELDADAGVLRLLDPPLSDPMN